MKKKAVIIIGIILLLDLACLVFFGKSYTKLVILPPFFYAHDVILTGLTVVSIWFFNKDNRIPSFELLCAFAILYLFSSFYKINFDFSQSYVVLRQFMIFGYGASIYIIMNALFGVTWIKQNSSRFIMYFAALCIACQVAYTFYLLLVRSSHVFFERNYLSPIIIMGFLIAASFVLTFVSGKFKKNVLFLVIFLISFSTGHDSTYLSLGLIYFGYFFIISPRSFKIAISVILLFGGIAAVIFLPSFTDVNVQWRLLYWKDSLLRITNNFVVFGDGFGVPYASDDTVLKLNELYPDTVYSPKIIGDEKYLTAPHNSFITMAIHTGIISIILFLYPLRTLFYNKKLILDKEILFLSLSLLGIMVFSSFNVVLELPHSSSIFWIVFFSLILKLSEKVESPSYQRELL